MEQSLHFRSLLLGSVILATTSLAYAADVTWDITPGTIGAGDSLITGGLGAWNTTNGNWTTDAGVTNIAWVNANNDTAIFGGTAGTVTLGTGITVGGLTFNTAGYTVTGNTITFGTAGIITANADSTISSILAGAAITKAGTGTLVLSGNNSYTTTTISAGTLQIGAGGATGTLGSGTVLNDATLIINRNDAFSVSNVISGSGSVRTNAGSAGQLIDIAANNSYSGGTFIDVGILRLRTDLGGGADLGTGTVTVANGASYEIWAPSAKTLTNNIVLNGATGVDNRAALNHDGGTGLVTLTGTVTLNATSDIGIGGGSSNNMIISGVVSGAAGAGLIVDEKNVGGTNYTLTLSGANTYTGATSVTGGTLKAGVASVANVSGAFGNNSAITLSNSAGVVLDITGFATQIGSLTGGGASGGNVTLGAATLTVGGDNTSPAAYAGVISGTGGVTKIGTGTQILSGTNTYTGTTTVSAGTLTFAGSSSGTLGAITVGGGGTTELKIQAGSYTLGAGGFYVGNGNGAGIVSQTGGTVAWNSTNLQLLIGNGGFAGTYNLSGGFLTTLTGTPSRGVMLGVNSNSNATFNLSGTGTLTVAGTSRLMIGRSDTTQTNTTNLFSQTGGTATISDMTMGGTSGGAGSGNSATLTLTGGTFTASAFSLLSAANNDVSTINISGTAVVTLPNLPTARGTSATATINFDGGTLRNSATGAFITGLTNAFIQDGGAQFDTLLNSTTISQNLLTHGSSLNGGLTKIGINTLTLSGTNTYTGGTTVSSGILTMGSAGALGSTSGQLTVNTGGTLDMGSQNLTVGNLTGTGGTISGTSAGTRTLTIGQGNGTGGNYQGAIQNGTGTTALTKTGTGFITLSGTNTYTGATLVSGGTLAVNGSLANTSSTTVGSGAILQGSGSISSSVTIQGNGTLASGNSIESLGTGALTFDANSTLAYEIDKDAVAGLAGDLTYATGNFTLALTNDSILTLTELGAGSWNLTDKLTLISYTGSWNGGLFDYLGVDLVDDSQFVFSGATWLFNYNDTLEGANFTADSTGTFVTMTVVPEPSVALLSSIGLLFFLRRRR